MTMIPDTSRYSTFLQNYNEGISQLNEQLSGSFFENIKSDKNFIQEQAGPDNLLSKKISEIDAYQHNTQLDNYTKLKLTGKILQDIAPMIVSDPNINIKRSGASIINSFFDVARQTEDEELLRTASTISRVVNGVPKPVAVQNPVTVQSTI